MRKIKFTLGLLVIILVSLVIYQNRAYFFAKQALTFILVPEKFQWTLPAVENVAYFGICLAIGILIVGYLGLVSKLRTMKTIKQHNKTILSQTDTIESLKAELENFKHDQSIEQSSTGSATLIPPNSDLFAGEAVEAKTDAP